ncbi:MAG: hypothetical protein FJ033_15670 [Chloroflexi bacterium]|nr:hypothetical protein [Chloroflexota bacterium]
MSRQSDSRTWTRSGQVVATLQRASIIFTLMPSWRMNRDLELLTRRLVVSVVVSVAGAVLLVVASTG